MSVTLDERLNCSTFAEDVSVFAVTSTIIGGGFSEGYNGDPPLIGEVVYPLATLAQEKIFAGLYTASYFVGSIMRGF